MAKFKRMINCDFVNASSFKVKRTNESNLLYFFILTNADDKGFVDNMDELIMILNGKSRSDAYDKALKELIENDYLYEIKDNHGNNIYLIKHWYVHNQIPDTRVRESSYENFLERFIIDDKKYQCKASVKQVPNKCQTKRGNLSAQNKINKSKVKKNKVNDIKEIKDKESNTIEELDDELPF